MCNTTIANQMRKGSCHLLAAANAKLRLAKAACGHRGKPKSVRFHGTVQVALKQVSKEELSDTWYGPLEYKDFQKDSKRSLKAITASLVCGMPADAKVHCLRGLEACLTPHMYQRRKDEKVAIVRHVLNQQLLQKLFGVHDPQLLAQLSQELSQKAQQRAHLLANFDTESDE
jgi:hypothetical protein